MKREKLNLKERLALLVFSFALELIALMLLGYFVNIWASISALLFYWAFNIRVWNGLGYYSTYMRYPAIDDLLKKRKGD